MTRRRNTAGWMSALLAVAAACAASCGDTTSIEIRGPGQPGVLGAAADAPAVRPTDALAAGEAGMLWVGTGEKRDARAWSPTSGWRAIAPPDVRLDAATGTPTEDGYFVTGVVCDKAGDDGCGFGHLVAYEFRSATQRWSQLDVGERGKSSAKGAASSGVSVGGSTIAVGTELLHLEDGSVVTTSPANADKSSYCALGGGFVTVGALDSEMDPVPLRMSDANGRALRVDAAAEEVGGPLAAQCTEVGPVLGPAQRPGTDVFVVRPEGEPWDRYESPVQGTMLGAAGDSTGISVVMMPTPRFDEGGLPVFETAVVLYEKGNSGGHVVSLPGNPGLRVVRAAGSTFVYGATADDNTPSPIAEVKG